jgi:D-galactarolactone cycloisomerase
VPSSPDPLTITAVEPLCLRIGPPVRPDGSLPYRVAEGRGTLYSEAIESVWVRITTADGTVGWGEALTPVAPRATAALITDLLTPALLGQDAGRVAPLRARLVALMRERGHASGHQADAIAGVDIALWDVVGRHHGVSVSELLGGAFHDPVPTYCTAIGGPVEEALPRRLAEGHTRFKLHGAHGVGADLAMVRTARELAPNALIALDVHCRYSLPEATLLARGLDELGVWFLESATAPEDVLGHARLRATVDTPLAIGEALRNRYEFADWLRAEALDFCQPDVCRTGLTEGRSIATLAAAAHRQLLPHHSAALGPGLAAGLHLAATTELMPGFEVPDHAVTTANKLLLQPLVFEPDSAPVPTGPGLGIEIDEDLVRSLVVER